MRFQRGFWLATTISILMVVAFLSGLGLRRLHTVLSPGDAFLMGRLASLTQPRDQDLTPSTLFLEALRKLRVFYVEPLPSDTTPLSYGAVEGMLAELDDPNTRLIKPREWEALREAGEGRVRGLGAWLTIRGLPEADSGVERVITVVSVFPGSPAERAGLRAGDRITYLGEQWIVDRRLSRREMLALQDSLSQDRPPPRDVQLPLDASRQEQRERSEELRRRWLNHVEIGEAILQLLTGEGEQELTFERDGAEEPRKVTVNLAPTNLEPVTERQVDARTAYVRIHLLSEAAVGAVEELFRGYEARGIRNLVLDLRQSPGGTLEAANRIASMLVADGTLVVLDRRNEERQPVERPVSTRLDEVIYRPAALSVMIDGGTAGASEVLAAALRDNLGVRLLGEHTFGDGRAEEILEFDNGAALSITSARMLTPRHKADYEGRGLTPADALPEGEAAIAAAARAVSPVRRIGLTPATD